MDLQLSWIYDRRGGAQWCYLSFHVKVDFGAYSFLNFHSWHLFSHFFWCRIRDITKEVAAAVVKEAIQEDLAEGYRGMDVRELQKLNEVEITNLNLVFHLSF